LGPVDPLLAAQLQLDLPVVGQGLAVALKARLVRPAHEVDAFELGRDAGPEPLSRRAQMLRRALRKWPGLDDVVDRLAPAARWVALELLQRRAVRSSPSHLEPSQKKFPQIRAHVFLTRSPVSGPGAVEI